MAGHRRPTELESTELAIVPDADLYDRKDLIPFTCLEAFLLENLK